MVKLKFVLIVLVYVLFGPRYLSILYFFILDFIFFFYVSFLNVEGKKIIKKY
jgi:hypothetical protein